MLLDTIKNLKSEKQNQKKILNLEEKIISGKQKYSYKPPSPQKNPKNLKNQTHKKVSWVSINKLLK